jgi:hypothetical protein
VAGIRFAAQAVARLKSRLSEADPLFSTAKMNYGIVLGHLIECADAVEAEIVSAVRAPSADAEGRADAEGETRV